MAKKTQRSTGNDEPQTAERHPEDLIFETKSFLNNLSQVQDEKLAALVLTLGISERGEDWLFDYIHNCDEPVTFDEYLERFGTTYDEIVTVKSGKTAGRSKRRGK